MIAAGHKEKGELVLTRRPTKSNHKPWDFISCEYCYGFFLKNTLWSHFKVCPLKPGHHDPVEKKHVRNGQMMLSPFMLKMADSNENDLTIFFD